MMGEFRGIITSGCAATFEWIYTKDSTNHDVSYSFTWNSSLFLMKANNPSQVRVFGIILLCLSGLLVLGISGCMPNTSTSPDNNGFPVEPSPSNWPPFGPPTGNPLPVATPFPTYTPFSADAPFPKEIIVDATEIIDLPVEEVEKLLREPYNITPLTKNLDAAVPNGGESRDYVMGKYNLWVSYDLNGIAKGVQVIDGLLDEGYSLEDWAFVLLRVGLEVVEKPYAEGLYALRWKNTLGYNIFIASDEYFKIYTVKIYRVPKGSTET